MTDRRVTVRATSRNTQKSIRVLKTAGMSAEELWRKISGDVDQAAREGNWRPSERAFSLGALYQEMVTVYGKRTMRKADEKVKADQVVKP